MHILPVLLMYALWSSTFPIGKWLLDFSTPVFLTGSRMFFAGILIVLFLILKNRGLPKLNLRQWAGITIVALLGIYLTNILEFYGLKNLSAGKTCFIYSLSPFFAALFSYLHFGEKMNKLKWIGMSVGFLGFIPALDFNSSESFIPSLSLPELAVAGAALASVYSWVVFRMMIKDNDIPPSTVNGYSMLIGGAIALIHSFVLEGWNPLPVETTHIPSLLIGISAMTFVSNIVCYQLYGLMAKRFTTTLLSFFGLLSPIFASLNSWILIGEAPSLKIFISTGIVCLGLFIFYRTELKQGYIKQNAV